VVRTRVGYAGGSKENPTYHNLGNHSETVQVDYDPTKVSYEELLAVFWEAHNPTYRSPSQQYMSIIFIHNGGQRELAEASKAQEAAGRRGDVVTEIKPYSGFYLAENYHQKYVLRQRDAIMADFERMYHDPSDFIDSTAAARVNGYVAGHGTSDSLQEDLDSFGLTESAEETLLREVGG
jgi:methionine-S-sulfoxide reductase